MNKMYEPGSVGICPHCGRETKFVPVDGGTLVYDHRQNISRYSVWHEGFAVGTASDFLFIDGSKCFICDKMVIGARTRPLKGHDKEWDFRIWPRGSERPVSERVPNPVAEVFKRASRLVGVDDTAAGAFARTCLEKVLSQQGVPVNRAVKKGTKVLSLSLDVRLQVFTGALDLGGDYTPPDLPADVKSDVQAIRQIGNFIHLNESIATGEVVDLSGEDANFALDLLEELFDVLYVAPAQRAEKRARFDDKLQQIGKANIGSKSE